MGFDVCDNQTYASAMVKEQSFFYDRVRSKPEQKSEQVQFFHLETQDENQTTMSSWNAFGLPAEKLFFIEAPTAPATSSNNTVPARDHLLPLLELAAEAGCETAVLCVNRNNVLLKEQLRAYLYLGFTLIEPDKLCSDNSMVLLSYKL
eukprot:gnl/Hemi2/26390_TR8860_c0_g1_i1.p1 gnl/Hemi2/26390_TR8860_c0_g1~~gnl/Hemi2/26390_TR8860_c0_g1_i1.p1  ORF type:complete len:148 (-),score=53.79 gnl/Hemi2/26390_TR8860_c0_g1_i1:575-1018(-)